MFSKKKEPIRSIETGLRAGMAAAFAPTMQMRRNVGGPLRLSKVGELPSEVTKFTPSGSNGYDSYTLGIQTEPKTTESGNIRSGEFELVKGVNSEPYSQNYSGQNNNGPKNNQYYNNTGVLRTRKNTTPPPALPSRKR